MKLAVFSDIHGNLPAFKIMLKDAGEVDGYICLGDTVNYGPWSDECVELLSSLKNVISLRGNHEEDFLNGSFNGTNEIAQTFFDFCQPKFTRYADIKNLKEVYRLNDFTFKHTLKDRENVYVDSDIKLDGNYVIGHSHHQFMINQPPYKLFNTGSVGQNRGQINVINYLILESNGMQFTERKITYDVDSLINEMKKKGYPKSCIDYYNSKPRA